MKGPPAVSVPLLAAGAALVALGAAVLLLTEDDPHDFEYPAPNAYRNHEPLFAPRTMGQTFRATEDNLQAIGVHLSAYREERPTGRVILHLRRTPGDTEDLRRAVIPALVIRREIREQFTFDPIPGSGGEAFFFFLESPDTPPERAIGVRYERADNEDGRDYPEGERTLDGAPAGGDLAFTLDYRERPVAAVQAFAALILLGTAAVAAGLPLLPRRTTRARRFIAVIAAGLPIIALFPLLRDLRAAGFEGWDPFPPSFAFSPLAGAVALLGPAVGAKLLAAVHIAAGFWGLWYLLRAYGRSALGALLGSSVFFFSTFFALRIAYGQFQYLALAGLPWVLWLLARARRNSRFAIPAGALLGLLFLESDATLAAHITGFLLLFSLIVALRRSRLATGERILPVSHRRALASALAAVTIGLAIGSVHLLPSARTLLAAPPPGAVAPVPPRAFLDIFLDPNQVGYAEKFPDQSLWWYEYGAYVGVFPLLLAAMALAFSPRAAFPFALTGIIVFIAAYAPRVHTFMDRLPALRALGHEQRLVGFALLILAILAAYGLDALRSLLAPPVFARARFGRRIRQVAFWTLVMIIVSDLLLVNAPVFLTAFVVPP